MNLFTIGDGEGSVQPMKFEFRAIVLSCGEPNFSAANSPCGCAQFLCHLTLLLAVSVLVEGTEKEVNLVIELTVLLKDSRHLHRCSRLLDLSCQESRCTSSSDTEPVHDSTCELDEM